MEWHQERTASFSHATAAGFKPPPGVRLNYAKTDLGSMMLRGELDAAIIQSGSVMDRPKADVSRHPAIRPLFRDYRREGIRYYKAGVMLMELSPAEETPGALFSGEPAGRTERLMEALDRVNGRMGRETLRLGMEGFRRAWWVKAERRSPRYTTRWEEIPVVRA